MSLRVYYLSVAYPMVGLSVRQELAPAVATTLRQEGVVIEGMDNLKDPPAPRRPPIGNTALSFPQDSMDNKATEKTTSPSPYSRRRHLPSMGRERGAGSVELVIATPLLMLLLLGIVQFAVWSHATHIAQAAAAHGLAASRVTTGTETDGHAAAYSVVDQLGDGPLVGAQVEVARGPSAVSVRITGTAAQVVPFLNLPVHAEAAGPVERFVGTSG